MSSLMKKRVSLNSIFAMADLYYIIEIIPFKRIHGVAVTNRFHHIFRSSYHDRLRYLRIQLSAPRPGTVHRQRRPWFSQEVPRDRRTRTFPARATEGHLSGISWNITPTWFMGPWRSWCRRWKTLCTAAQNIFCEYWLSDEHLEAFVTQVSSVIVHRLKNKNAFSKSFGFQAFLKTKCLCTF